MAYEIIGNVYRIGATENISTRSGGTLQRRSVTLVQKRFDQNTGEEFEPNYPTFDFANRGCAELDRFRQGDRVRIRFDISGVKYTDRNTQEEKFFTSLRGFRIEPLVAGQVQPQPACAPQPQYPPQPSCQPQQGYYSQQAPQNPPQYPPQSAQPQQAAGNGLPF